MLIGRSHELDYLTNYYNQADNSLIVLYGQKGLGVSSLLFEFAKEKEALEIMDRHFQAAINFYRTKGIEVEVELVGSRPCSGDVNEEEENRLFDRIAKAVWTQFGVTISRRSGSTDCNIPLSLGIPSACVGCYAGAGAHTREESVEISSLLPGLKLAFELILHHFE